MPQHIALNLPFPQRISPDVETVSAQHVDWLTGSGLLNSRANIDRYREWHLDELAGRFYPDAVTDDLALGLQGQCFFFFFDDLFDGAVGTAPAETYEICHSMMLLSRGRPLSTLPIRDLPLAHIWRDLWRRCKDGMSRSWTTRAAIHWQQYFQSYVSEAVIRTTGRILSVDDYLAARRHAIGTDGVLDFAERCQRFEAPPVLHATIYFQQIRAITADVVVLTNDLHSLEKDEANGDPNNLILLLAGEHKVSRSAVVRRLQEMINRRLSRFADLTHIVEDVCGAVALESTGQTHTQRFLAAAGACMRGNYDWSRRTNRYSAIGIKHVQQSARIEDKITTGHYRQNPGVAGSFTQADAERYP
ncbi:terpene synthase family protein [Nocardia wallacei]|uniref:terpene synthase family protein n=1 Tax=Nocardia wallacei TaxID=480035 RepID=UPI002458AA7A|nr:hypothetical protein [Nocardia wallacei]